MSMSERIKEMRKKRGLSQTDLATKLGVSMKTVARWESGERVPNALYLEMLERNLKTTYDYLKGATDDPSPRVYVRKNLSQTSDKATTENSPNGDLDDRDLFTNQTLVEQLKGEVNSNIETEIGRAHV